MAYWKACEVRVISTWVCAVRNETDVAINEIHSEVERSELSIPEASNSLLGIKLRLPAWGEPPQLAPPSVDLPPLSKCSETPRVELSWRD